MTAEHAELVRALERIADAAEGLVAFRARASPGVIDEYASRIVAEIKHREAKRHLAKDHYNKGKPEND